MGRGRINQGLALAATIAALAACSRPDWTDPAKSHDQRELAAAPVPPVPVVATPLPAPPAWAVGLIGRPLRSIFGRNGVCVGQTEAVALRFQAPPTGARIHGWGVNVRTGHGVERVLLVDKDLKIIGAGSGGLPEAQVGAAARTAGSANAGWQADGPALPGPVRAFGITDAASVCPLGQVQP